MDARRVMLCLAMLILPAIAAASATGRQNDNCLVCHGNKEIIKKGGERLYIESGKFAATTHSVIRCPPFHDSVTAKHPHYGNKPSKARCKECHAPIQAEYANSLHGNKA